MYYLAIFCKNLNLIMETKFGNFIEKNQVIIVLQAKKYRFDLKLKLNHINHHLFKITKDKN